MRVTLEVVTVQREGRQGETERTVVGQCEGPSKVRWKGKRWGQGQGKGCLGV